MVRLAFAAMVFVVPIASLTAQEEHRVRGRTIVLGPAELHPAPARSLDIPPPPGAAVPPSVAPLPTLLPVARSRRPQPDTPPTTLASEPRGPGAPCDAAAYTNTIVRPAGASIHTVAEPSVAVAGTTLADSDALFYTGNQFAGLSRDAGQTWTHVNPYTRFPALDGGFCCDQRTLYLASRDITVWYLQYWPSDTTRKGSIRLAVSVGRDGLRNDVWHSFVFSPQLFGFPAGYWFDFPGLACSDDHLFLSANIITPAPWQNVNALVLKMSLDELRVAGGNLNAVYWTESSGLGDGSNYRFAQGSTATMYFASHRDSATLRVFRNADASDELVFRDQSVAAWSRADVSYVSLLGNGVNWADRAVPFVKGAYANDREYGFLWHAGVQAGRPQPYVRIARFATADHRLLGEEDVWSPNLAFLYPAATTSAAGAIGVVMAAGGPAQKPVSALLIVDDCRPTFGGAPLVGFAFSTHDPSYAGWGDYFTMQRHPARTLSFVASGLAQNGGSGTSDQAPRYIHFGRQRDDLAWTSVIVTSAGVDGVPIAVSPSDQLGKASVTTPGYASYAQAAAFTLTAPATHVEGSTTYEFVHWRHRLTPIGAWTTLPPGQLTLTNPRIGARDDTAVAVYGERVPATVSSYGAGCAGSNGRVPVHFTGDLPELGSTATYRVRDLFGATSASLFLGFSNSVWNGIPLPLGLGLIGADPTCSLLAAGAFTLPFGTDAGGAGAVNLKITGNPSHLGAHFYTQVIALDPGAAAPLGIVVSDALDSTIGGLRLP